MPTARSSDSRAPAKYPRAGSDRISLPQCLDETQNHSHHPGILGVSRCPIMDQPEIAYRPETLAEPNNIMARQAAGTVHVHPNGRFLYGANCADATVEFRASKSSKAVKTASWCTRSINQPASRPGSSISRPQNSPVYLSHRHRRTLIGC